MSIRTHLRTLVRTSELADAVIARVYDIAVAEARASYGDSAGHRSNEMWVIALGRLGMREFDLASDADLVFVLADSDADGTGVLDPRRRAHRRPDHRLHRRRRVVRGRHAPAPERRRRPSGADRIVLQRIFRAHRRGLGRYRVHEVPRRGRGRRSAPSVFFTSCRRSTGSATARADARAAICVKCA